MGSSLAGPCVSLVAKRADDARSPASRVAKSRGGRRTWLEQAPIPWRIWLAAASHGNVGILATLLAASPLSATNMRISPLLALAVLAACASPPPSACPCQARGFGYESFGASTFIDTDDDGIPDARVNDSETPASVSDQVRQEIGRACTEAVRAADGRDLDAALAKLAATVAEARRKLDAQR